MCDIALQVALEEREQALALLAAEAKHRGPDFAKAAGSIQSTILQAAIDPFATFKPKLLIWDLDDTLWRGTLAEGDDVMLIERRAEIVRALNQHGIVSAICSKNDFDGARAKLEAFGLWDAFAFRRIAFAPKGEAVRQLIEDMQLRPENVLFLDDNPHNLHEVAATVPGIHIIDATMPECDTLLERILAEHRHIQRDRLSDYRILQAKVEERAASSLTNEAFLRASDIHVLFTQLTENAQFSDRIEELINRSNQLNYTNSRIAEGDMAEYILRFTLY